MSRIAVISDTPAERSNLAYVGNDDAANNLLRKGPIKSLTSSLRTAPGVAASVRL